MGIWYLRILLLLLLLLKGGGGSSSDHQGFQIFQYVVIFMPHCPGKIDFGFFFWYFFIIFKFFLHPPPPPNFTGVMGCGAAEATGLSSVCFVVINPRVLSSANRVYLVLFINFPILRTLEWWDAVLQKRLAWAFLFYLTYTNLKVL